MKPSLLWPSWGSYHWESNFLSLGMEISQWKTTSGIIKLTFVMFMYFISFLSLSRGTTIQYDSEPSYHWYNTTTQGNTNWHSNLPFPQLMCQDFQMLLLWVECMSSRFVHNISVVKPYIKHTRKQFIKMPIQVPMQKKAQTRNKNYVWKVRGVGQTKRKGKEVPGPTAK